MEDPILQLALIVVAGVTTQWLASMLRLPSILLMMIAGLLVGPLLNAVNPDELLGSLLEPSVSLAVALILFEGALGIRFSQIRGVNSVVWRLVTLGVAVTWLIGVVAAIRFTDMSREVAALAAAILVVSGPTVIGPMLRQLRPRRPTSSILRWESILIDPLGAMLAVVVLEALVVGGGDHTPADAAWQVLRFVASGTALGVTGAGLLIVLLRRRWVPDHLRSGMTLMMALGVFVVANLAEAEAGLLAVTAAGIVLANQSFVDFSQIVEFKENLRVLLISSVFVVLTARLEIAALQSLVWPAIWVVTALVLVARPLGVVVSTLGSGLSSEDRLFLMALAPRGIVAALVATVFSGDLDAAGIDGSQLGPFVFLVIGLTALVYGIAGPLVGRRLGVSDPDPHGVLILGAGVVARAIGQGLSDEGFAVTLAATRRSDEYRARMEGFETFYGDILADGAVDDMNLYGIGQFLALTPNHEYNSLAVIQYRAVFGSERVFQLARGHDPGGEQTQLAAGRVLFDDDLTYDDLDSSLDSVGSIRSTKITERFGYADYLDQNPGSQSLFLISDGKLRPITEDQRPTPVAGDTILALVPNAIRTEE